VAFRSPRAQRARGEKFGYSKFSAEQGKSISGEISFCEFNFSIPTLGPVDFIKKERKERKEQEAKETSLASRFQPKSLAACELEWSPCYATVIKIPPSMTET